MDIRFDIFSIFKIELNPRMLEITENEVLFDEAFVVCGALKLTVERLIELSHGDFPVAALIVASPNTLKYMRSSETQEFVICVRNGGESREIRLSGHMTYAPKSVHVEYF